MRDPVGSIYRAVAPFSPEPPFRLFAGVGEAPVIVNETPRLTDGGGTEFTVLVPAKARPVLVIAPPSPRCNEVLALRLRRFSRMAEGEQRIVRADEDDGFVYLDPGICPGLGEENAALVGTAMRLPVSALDFGRPLGRIDSDRVAVVHERFVRLHELDLHGLVAEKARVLLATAGRDG